MIPWNRVRPFRWPLVWSALMLWGPWAGGVIYLWVHTDEVWPLSEGLAGWLYFAGAPANGPFAALAWTGKLNFIEGTFLESLFHGFNWLMGTNIGLAIDENPTPFPLLLSLTLLAASAFLGQRSRLWLGVVLLIVGAMQIWSAIVAVDLLT